MTELVRNLTSKIDKMEKYVDEVLPLVREAFELKDKLVVNKIELKNSKTKSKSIGTGVAEKQGRKVWKEKEIAV